MDQKIHLIVKYQLQLFRHTVHLIAVHLNAGWIESFEKYSSVGWVGISNLEIIIGGKWSISPSRYVPLTDMSLFRSGATDSFKKTELPCNRMQAELIQSQNLVQWIRLEMIIGGIINGLFHITQIQSSVSGLHVFYDRISIILQIIRRRIIRRELIFKVGSFWLH